MSFSLAQIEQAHSQVKSGADFPVYIHQLKSFGVVFFITYVLDSHTEYFGENHFTLSSAPMYEPLEISPTLHLIQFKKDLQIHQQGGTDYFTFCKDCAKNGIEKWKVDLLQNTCTYYDTQANEVWKETIPNV